MKYFKILQKVELDEELRDAIKYRVEPNVIRWDDAAAANVGDLEIPLTPEEQVTIKRLIESWPSFRPIDAPWLMPLMEKLG